MTLDKNHDMFLAAFFNLLRGRMYTSPKSIFFSGYRCNKTKDTEFESFALNASILYIN